MVVPLVRVVRVPWRCTKVVRSSRRLAPSSCGISSCWAVRDARARRGSHDRRADVRARSRACRARRRGRAGVALVALARSRWSRIARATRRQRRGSLAAIDVAAHETLPIDRRSIDVEREARAAVARPARRSIPIPTSTGTPLDELYPSLLDWIHPVTGTDEHHARAADRARSVPSATASTRQRVRRGPLRRRSRRSASAGRSSRSPTASSCASSARELGRDGRSGRYVRIEHDDGTLTAYMHLDDDRRRPRGRRPRRRRPVDRHARRDRRLHARRRTCTSRSRSRTSRARTATTRTRTTSIRRRSSCARRSSRSAPSASTRSSPRCSSRYRSRVSTREDWMRRLGPLYGGAVALVHSTPWRWPDDGRTAARRARRSGSSRSALPIGLVAWLAAALLRRRRPAGDDRRDRRARDPVARIGGARSSAASSSASTARTRRRRASPSILVLVFGDARARGGDRGRSRRRTGSACSSRPRSPAGGPRCSCRRSAIRSSTTIAPRSLVATPAPAWLTAALSVGVAAVAVLALGKAGVVALALTAAIAFGARRRCAAPRPRAVGAGRRGRGCDRRAGRAARRRDRLLRASRSLTSWSRSFASSRAVDDVDLAAHELARTPCRSRCARRRRFGASTLSAPGKRAGSVARYASRNSLASFARVPRGRRARR